MYFLCSIITAAALGVLSNIHGWSTTELICYCLITSCLFAALEGKSK